MKLFSVKFSFQAHMTRLKFQEDPFLWKRRKEMRKKMISSKVCGHGQW